MSRFTPRGTSQTTTNLSDLYYNQTAGDNALLQQNAEYELLSQQFVASISVIKNGIDITDQAQNQLLSIRIEITPATAAAYQPTATAKYWTRGIVDFLAVYQQQVALAKSNGWI